MPRCVDNVKLVVTMDNAGALRQNCDSTLLLQIVAVHGSLRGEVDAGLLKQTVDKGRLAVIDVSNDGKVAYFLDIVALQDFHNLLHDLLVCLGCWHGSEASAIEATEARKSQAWLGQ